MSSTISQRLDSMAQGDIFDIEDASPPPSRIQDRISDDDADNPRNYSLTMRVYSTAVITMLSFVSVLAASIYSPAHDEVSKAFGISDEVAILPLSVYNLGLACGPLIGAPLSETYGRKIVYLVTTPVFALFIMGAGFAQNTAALVSCRFFAGVFAAPTISNASASITDFTVSRYRGVSLGIYYSVPFCGAVLGPLIGGFILQAKGWRWTQWVIVLLVVGFYIPVIFTRETYAKVILQRRMKKLNGGQRHARPTILQSTRHFVTAVITRPINMLFTETIVTLVCLYNGFLFGLIYTFVVACPWVYQHYYGFDLAEQSLSFLGLIIGTLVAPIPLILTDTYIYQPRLERHRIQHSDTDQFAPENRLFPSMAACFMLPISLFAFAWTVHQGVHWICPIIFQSLTILSSLLIYASVSLFMLDTYGPLYGASASGAAMLSRYTFSATFPLFSLQLYKALGVAWATSLLAFCTLGMAPIPWLFWHYGEALRSRTKYETSG